MKKIISIILGLSLLPLTAFGATTFVVNGGTSSTTLSGILLGAGTSPVQTLGIGTNLTLSGGVLSASGGGSSTFGTTSISALYPLSWNTSTAQMTFGGLSTSSNAVIGNIPYFSSANTFANVATSSPTFSSPLTTSGTAGYIIGGSSFAVGCQVASGSQAGCLSSTDWNTFNGKGSGTVTSVTGTYPIISSGGNTPAISTAFGTTTNNVYSGTNMFLNATNTIIGLTTINSTSTQATTSTFAITSLATPAGSFLAVNPLGSVIATTTPSGGAVSSVSNSDGTLTISPTTGLVVASLALTHANVWTPASTTFVGGVTMGTATTTSATSTNLYVSGNTSLAGMYTGINDPAEWAGSTWNLAVNGNAYVQSVLDVNGAINAGAYKSGSGGVIGMFFSGTDEYIGGLTNFTVQAANVNFTNSGNIGIASTSPSAKLSIDSFNLGGQPQFIVASSTGSGATSTALEILSNGNVGINTATPNYTLEVQGTASTTNFYATQATSTNATTSTFAITSLATGAGAFLAITPAGNVIATTTPSGGAVSSVSNSNGTLTISPTTGSVVSSLALGHSNVWSAASTTFNGGLTALTATTTNATTSTFAISSLGTPAGTMLAVNPAGTVIATATPSSFVPIVYASTTPIARFGLQLTPLAVTSGQTFLLWGHIDGASGDTINLDVKHSGWVASSTIDFALPTWTGVGPVALFAEFVATTSETDTFAIDKPNTSNADSASILVERIK